MDRLDLCDAMKTHKVDFILNPANEWSTFPQHLKVIVQQQWNEFKLFSNNSRDANPELDNIPNNCGGIYIFLIRPNILAEVPVYVAYIGRAKNTQYQNLRKRVKEYIPEGERLKINNLKRKWGEYLYVRYLPLVDNCLIEELEDELIKAMLPPFNDKYPDIYHVARKAAF